MQTTLVDERWLLVGQGCNIGYSVTESWCLQKICFGCTFSPVLSCDKAGEILMEVPSLCPGGSSRDHRGESHSLKSARASSRPGNNGEAYLSGSPHGYQRGESYSLTSGCTELVRSWRSSLSIYRQNKPTLIRLIK